MSAAIIHHQNTVSRPAFWENMKMNEFIESCSIIWSLIYIHSKIAIKIYCRQYAPMTRSLAWSSYMAWKVSEWSFIFSICCLFICCTFVDKNKLIWLSFSQMLLSGRVKLFVVFIRYTLNLNTRSAWISNIYQDSSSSCLRFSTLLELMRLSYWWQRLHILQIQTQQLHQDRQCYIEWRSSQFPRSSQSQKLKNYQQNTYIKHFSSQFSWMILGRELQTDGSVEMLQISSHFIYLSKRASFGAGNLRRLKPLL